MGTGLSKSNLVNLTSDEVADHIVSIGKAFAEYRERFIDNGFDGSWLASFADDKDKDKDKDKGLGGEDAMMGFLADLEITNKLHVRRLMIEFAKFKAGIKEEEERSSVATSPPAPPLPPPGSGEVLEVLNSLTQQHLSLAAKTGPGSAADGARDGEKKGDKKEGGEGGGGLFTGRAMSGGTEKLFECGICLSPMNGPVTLPCGHSACKAPCLQSWFSGNDNCPICRASVPTSVRQDLRSRDIGMM